MTTDAMTLKQAKLIVVCDALQKAIEKIREVNVPTAMGSSTWKSIFAARAVANKEFIALITPENIQLLLDAVKEKKND